MNPMRNVNQDKSVDASGLLSHIHVCFNDFT